MAGKHHTDEQLLDSISGGLMETIPVFQKKLLESDRLQRTCGLPWSNIQILTLLKNGAMTIGQISEVLGIAKPNLTPVLDTMSEKNLISRFRDENDHRIVHVMLTEDGGRMLEQIRQTIRDNVEAWSEKMNRSELKDMNNAVSVIIKLMRTMD